MPALSFSVAKDKIKSGAKRQTIRGDRKFPIKEGDKLFLWWMQRSKNREKLGEAFCLSVRSVTISTDNLSYCDNGYDSTVRDDFDLLKFAVDDGFNNWSELVVFFENQHGLPFTGNLIMWDELQ